MSKPALEKSRFGLKIKVFENRLEVEEGMWPMKKKRTIPYSNMSSIEIERGTQRLVIKTNDGKQYKWTVSGFGANQAIREAVVERM